MFFYYNISYWLFYSQDVMYTVRELNINLQIALSGAMPTCPDSVHVSFLTQLVLHCKTELYLHVSQSHLHTKLQHETNPMSTRQAHCSTSGFAVPISVIYGTVCGGKWNSFQCILVSATSAPTLLHRA